MRPLYGDTLREEGVIILAEKRSERGSDTLYKYPAGTISPKARVGANAESKQPNEAGNLPDDRETKK